MSVPKEPRQLMINLMYLVLTAMLALNVSSEILHAFKIINQSITQSNTSINSKNNELHLAFDANEARPEAHDRVKEYNDKAKQISKEADILYNYLENWKERVIEESGGYKIDNGEKEIKAESNIDASTVLLVEKKGGDTLKQKLADFKKMAVSVLFPDVQKQFEEQLPIRINNPKKSESNPQADWSYGNFHSMPVMAVVTLMSKFQNDVRNTESLIINELFKEADAKQMKFDAIAAIAVPKTSYALVGQKVEAQIMLAAYNKSVKPNFSDGRVKKVEDGIGFWETAATGVGLQTVKGTLSIDMNGTKITEPWEFQYMVGSAGASLQLDKMNVLYIGVPNPITVSAAGYSLEDVSVNIPGATLNKTGNGKYDVIVSAVGQVNATINAKADGGKSIKTVGTIPLRIKEIPPPTPKVGGKSSGVIPTNVFKAQGGIVAELANFDFDAKFVVTSYDISVLPKRGDPKPTISITGPYMNKGAAASYIEGLRAGDKVFFENIKAVGPDKKVRPVGTLIFTLN